MAQGLLGGRRTKSYGSLTSSSSAPQKRVEHEVRPGDTLQGLALKYGVSMEQIKRSNRLYTNDSIFLKKTLYIPVLSESPPFTRENKQHVEECIPHQVPAQNGRTDAGSPDVAADLSPSDYLRRMDGLIRESKQAAVKTCQAGEREFSSAEALRHGSQDVRTSPSSQRAVLGSVPLTITKRTRRLMGREDEIFQL